MTQAGETEAGEGGDRERERDTAEDSEASHESERNRATKPRGGGETDRPRWPRLAGREAGAGTGGGGDWRRREPAGRWTCRWPLGRLSPAPWDGRSPDPAPPPRGPAAEALPVSRV